MMSDIETAARLEQIAAIAEREYAKLTPAQQRKAAASSPESVAAMRARAARLRGLR